MDRDLTTVIILVIISAWLYTIGAQPSTVRVAVASDPGDWRSEWATDLLHSLGNDQPSQEIVHFVIAWTLAEDRSDNAYLRNNPLNTTQEGFNETSIINSHGVRGYATYKDGLSATIYTLENGRYPNILYGLQSNRVESALDDYELGTWGTGLPNVLSVFREPNQLSTEKCPYTTTMEYPPGSSFYSTGSSAWSGQYGSMHLGVDFTGSTGDPVFAPFDMIIDSVGFYNDPGRYGNNIQARFVKDNYLYYAGHLIDVFVSPGDVIQACTQIGTLGATDQPHVHIKIAYPDAPIPCEVVSPGEGGCIDPISYWNES